MDRLSRSTLMKWGIILCLAIPHAFLVLGLKSDYQGSWSILPVAATGWFFGIVPGALAGLIAVFLTLTMNRAAWSILLSNNFVLGAPVLILIGGMAGWARNIYGKQSQRDLELTKRLQEADALSKINIALGQAERVGLSSILQLIVDSAKKIIPGAEQAVIHILDEEKNLLIAQAVTGYQNANYVEIKMRLGEGVAGQVISSGETINIADVNSDPRFLKPETTLKFRSLMVAPVTSGQQKLGTIS